MMALTSSSPTVRIPMTTVTAASAESSMPIARTRIPRIAALSESIDSDSSSGPKTASRSSATAAVTTSTLTSVRVTVEIAPKRYDVSDTGRRAAAKELSMTPPAMPP